MKNRLRLAGAILGVTLGVGSIAHAQSTATPTLPGYLSASGCASGVSVCWKPGAPGSTGADFSANAPTLPNVGANFGAMGPFANYVLVATVPANPARTNVDIENDAGVTIAVVRDDGTAAGGAAPRNASVFAINGGTVGQQGGSWTSTTFKGRLQIYAPAALSGSAFVSVPVD
jgi:hypothetical protein